MTQTVTILRAMGDPSRLRIMNALSRNSLCVNELQVILARSQPFISRHLAYLRKAGLVRDSRQGARIFYSLVLDTASGRAARAVLEDVSPLCERFQADLRKLVEYKKLIATRAEHEERGAQVKAAA